MSRELVDLDRLPKKMRDRLSSALSPEERLVVSIKGIGGALLATDRQILLWQRSTLTSYPLTSVSGIEWNLRGFNKWLRIAGDGLEEERPTFRNLPTRKNALGIGQTPQEQRRIQNEKLHQYFTEVIGPFSPYYKKLFAELPSETLNRARRLRTV